MKAKVLVVDDERDVEDLFRQNLRREVKQGKISLDFAFSGEDALSQLEQDHPKQVILILSDINMPGMSGLDLLSEVRPKRPDVSIYMITAYGDDGTKANAKERGADAFFTKPVDFKALRSELNRIIDEA